MTDLTNTQVLVEAKGLTDGWTGPCVLRAPPASRTESIIREDGLVYFPTDGLLRATAP